MPSACRIIRAFLNESRTPYAARRGYRSLYVTGTSQGDARDRRADIWEFGVVLHDMLTGYAAYTGETLTDVIAAVISRSPLK